MAKYLALACFAFALLTSAPLNSDASNENEAAEAISTASHNVISFIKKLKAGGRTWVGKMRATRIDESGDLVSDSFEGGIEYEATGRNRWRTSFNFCTNDRDDEPFCQDGSLSLRVVDGALYVVVGDGKKPKLAKATILSTSANNLGYTFREYQHPHYFVTTVHENITPEGKYIRHELVRMDGGLEETSVFSGSIPSPSPSPKP